MNYRTQIARLLRKEQTPAEAKLWEYLRDRRFKDLKFRRQHPIKEYIVDFFNQKYQIVIELDGEYHNSEIQKGKDELRDLRLKALGYKILRFNNEVIFKDIELVFNHIRSIINSSKTLPLLEGEGWGEGKKLENSPDINPLAKKSDTKEVATILSTKILTLSQKELLLNAGIGFIEYNAIRIHREGLLNFHGLKRFQNIIITSKNAAKAVFTENTKKLPLPFGVRGFCVGTETKKVLEENGLKVVEMAQNASDLAKIIIKNYKNERFLFLCGNLRRDELPTILKENTIDFEERIVYHTELNSRSFDRNFDGILFFSPSGVRSYVSNNGIHDAVAFCIGATTASEVRKHTDRIVIANKPTVENVIVQAVKYFKTNV